MAVAQAFALYPQCSRTPYTGADEDGIIAITEKDVQIEGAANGGVRADVDAQLSELLGVAVQDALRQAEIRYAVAHHATKMLHALKNGYIVAPLCQLDSYREAGRAGADNCHILPLRRLVLHDNLVQIRIGDVLLNAGNLHRGALDTLNAVALALGLMVAYQGADNAHRVVLKQHGTCLIDFSVQKKAYHFRDVGVGRTAINLALRFFALQAAAGFIDNVNSHVS